MMSPVPRGVPSFSPMEGGGREEMRKRKGQPRVLPGPNQLMHNFTFLILTSNAPKCDT